MWWYLFVFMACFNIMAAVSSLGASNPCDGSKFFGDWINDDGSVLDQKFAIFCEIFPVNRKNENYVFLFCCRL